MPTPGERPYRDVTRFFTLFIQFHALTFASNTSLFIFRLLAFVFRPFRRAAATPTVQHPAGFGDRSPSHIIRSKSHSAPSVTASARRVHAAAPSRATQSPHPRRLTGLFRTRITKRKAEVLPRRQRALTRPGHIRLSRLPSHVPADPCADRKRLSGLSRPTTAFPDSSERCTTEATQDSGKPSQHAAIKAYRR